MSKKKILIIALVVLLGGAYAAKGYVMPKKVVHEKISGTIYILPKQFMVNLQGNQYATLTAALVLAPGQSDGATADGGAAGGDTTEGFGTLPEEAAIREIITNVLTNQEGSTLISQSGRSRLKAEILSQIRQTTDVRVNDVLITDLAVQ